jgi:hypothetical protein
VRQDGTKHEEDGGENMRGTRRRMKAKGEDIIHVAHLSVPSLSLFTQTLIQQLFERERRNIYQRYVCVMVMNRNEQRGEEEGKETREKTAIFTESASLLPPGRSDS